MNQRILTLQNAFIDGREVVLCRDQQGHVLIALDAGAGSHDSKAMEVGGLEPSNDEDVFAYANHLLGNAFQSFIYIHPYQDAEMVNAYWSHIRATGRHDLSFTDWCKGLWR